MNKVIPILLFNIFRFIKLRGKYKQVERSRDAMSFRLFSRVKERNVCTTVAYTMCMWSETKAVELDFDTSNNKL